jgi:TIR domain
VNNTPSPDDALLQLIESRLLAGSSIEISGMGSFELDDNRRVVFKPSGRPLVFLSYAHEDRAKVNRLFRELQNAGLEPWMDCEKLMPGQNWPRAIQQTIEISDFFLACFSQNSTTKRGHFQGELALAREVATLFPEDDVYFVPLRLDECELPRRVISETHYIDLFPDWDLGVRKLIAALQRQHSVRHKRRP